MRHARPTPSKFSASVPSAQSTEHSHQEISSQRLHKNSGYDPKFGAISEKGHQIKGFDPKFRIFLEKDDQITDFQSSEQLHNGTTHKKGHQKSHLDFLGRHDQRTRISSTSNAQFTKQLYQRTPYEKGNNRTGTGIITEKERQSRRLISKYGAIFKKLRQNRNFHSDLGETLESDDEGTGFCSKFGRILNRDHISIIESKAVLTLETSNARSNLDPKSSTNSESHNQRTGFDSKLDKIFDRQTNLNTKFHTSSGRSKNKTRTFEIKFCSRSENEFNSNIESSQTKCQARIKAVSGSKNVCHCKIKERISNKNKHAEVQPEYLNRECVAKRSLLNSGSSLDKVPENRANRIQDFCSKERRRGAKALGVQSCENDHKFKSVANLDGNFCHSDKILPSEECLDRLGAECGKTYSNQVYDRNDDKNSLVNLKLTKRDPDPSKLFNNILNYYEFIRSRKQSDTNFTHNDSTNRFDGSKKINNNKRWCVFGSFGVLWWSLLCLSMTLSLGIGAGGSGLKVHKYSTREVRTKYGPLRGVIVHAHPPVEAFLGVPYATPPLGSLRYMPPVTPSQWRTTRLADRFASSCPQAPPPLPARADALLLHPRARVAHLERLLPLLKNHSEDCLYLNLYVPKTGDNASLPCLVYVHGESYEWNSGNPYDGTVLASQGHLIVVTINFRLGILGFLKTGPKGSAQGNFGLMDLVAGLHWLRENLPAFGGDPERVTLMGHGTGAALANFIAVSPVAKELLQRVILFSGSGLSSWALQREPLTVKRKVAEQTGCHGDLLEEDIAPCLRTKTLNELLAVRIDPPRFLPGFAPFVDGTVLLNPSQVAPPSISGGQSPSSASTVATAAGYELADFPERSLLFGLTSTESYLDLSAQDLEFGFNETRRDRILRTYVRNAYYFHLNEIFSTLKNEYTDWDRPVQNPLNVRDATLEVLSDGHTAAPLIRLGYLHAMRGGKTFFAHFQHLSSDRDYPQRTGSVHGEDIPYCFGLPLVGGQPFFPHNFTAQDQAISKLLIQYITNFAKTGDPNEVPLRNSADGSPGGSERGVMELDPSPQTLPQPLPLWDTYDTINQLYLEIGSRPEMRNHYRGHKMSLWLSLIPQLHRPGEAGLADMSMRHHHFLEEGAHYYEGSVRPQSMQRPNLPHLSPPSGAAPIPRAPPSPSASATVPVAPPATPIQPAPTTDCPPNATLSNRNIHKDNNNLLRKLASSHYQSYTTALTVTIAVGCFLLLLNILIFAGIYHQRDRNNGNFGDKKKEELAEAGSCSTSSGGENYDAKTLNFETQGQSYEANKSGFSYDCKSTSYQMKTGSKYDLRTFPSDCGKTAFGEYSCYDEKNLAAQYEKRSLADITLCSVPDSVDLPMQEFRKSPSKRCDNGSSIVKIDTQKPDIQRINNQSIRSLENQTSSFHENGSRLSLASGHERSRTSTFGGETIMVQDSSTQVKFCSGGDNKQTTFGPDGPCEEDLAGSSCSDDNGFHHKENTVSVGAQSEPTTCDVGTGVDRSPLQAEPPKNAQQPGILRQTNPNNSSSSGIMKKRVQIQEISV